MQVLTDCSLCTCSILQVLKPLLASLKQQISALKASRKQGGGSSPATSESKKSSSALGKYIELVLDTR